MEPQLAMQCRKERLTHPYLNPHKSSLFFHFLFLPLQYYQHHYYNLRPWISSFDLFRHRCDAVSWGARDPFYPGVCRWGRFSAVWCCPFFRGGWSSFVCIRVSRLVFQRSLVLFLWLMVYPPLNCLDLSSKRDKGFTHLILLCSI